MIRPQLRQIALHGDRARLGLSTAVRHFSVSRAVAAEGQDKPSRMLPMSFDTTHENPPTTGIDGLCGLQLFLTLVIPQVKMIQAEVRQLHPLVALEHRRSPQHPVRKTEAALPRSLMPDRLPHRGRLVTPPRSFAIPDCETCEAATSRRVASPNLRPRKQPQKVESNLGLEAQRNSRRMRVRISVRRRSNRLSGSKQLRLARLRSGTSRGRWTFPL